MRTCSRCGVEKALDAFFLNPEDKRYSKRYRRKQCIDCDSEHRKPEDSTKRCSKCGLVKTLEQFCRATASHDGYSWWCRPCKNGRTQVANQRAQNRYRSWVSSIKLERGCVDCGYNAHAAALEFDHRDASTKLFQISHGAGKPRERVLAEMAKCDIVCANCHRVRTYERRQGYGHDKDS